MKRSSTPRAGTRTPRTWLFLAADAAHLGDWAEQVRDLELADHRVEVATLGGKVPEAFPGSVKVRRVSASGRGPLGAATAPLARAVARVTGRAGGRTQDADPWLRDRLGTADHVVVVDDGFAEVLDSVPVSGRVWRGAQARDALAEEAAWRWLASSVAMFAARGSMDRFPPSGVVARATLLLERDHLDFAPEADLRPELRELARRLVRRGERDRALTLLDAAALHDRYYPELEDERPLVRALRTHVALADGVPLPDDFAQQVRDVLAVADRRFGADDTQGGCDVAVIGMALLFHQQLHTATEHSPLVDSPQEWLAPLLGTTFWRSLVERERAAREAEPAGTTAGRDAGRPAGVVVLPGSYGHHARPMVSALQEAEDTDVAVLELDDPAFAGMGLDSLVLRLRLDADRGQRQAARALAPTAAQTIEAADVVVADWADKGAVWASLLVRPGTRLVVRIHSVDVLSGPVHLVDWSRVDAVVAVSPHIRDVFLRVLGERAEGLRTQVVTNRILVDRFSRDKAEGADRTLGLVGWGQPVKDPLLALDILARLRAQDDRWRLKLMGADFRPNQAGASEAYADEFARRCEQPDVAGAVENVGFTDDLPGHLREVGFVLSTSIRESCPVGVLEGVASGALPVVRDWPVFARVNGARQLFPEGSVFETAEEAVEIIRSAEGDRAARAAAVRDELAGLFSEERTRGLLVDTVLGRA